MRIVVCFEFEPRHVEQIAAAAPDAEVVDATGQRVADEILAADVFCGHARVPLPWNDVVKQGRLRWIQSTAAGLDHCLQPSVIESDIIVTSASGVLADQVAEHTLALVTAWCRSFPVFFRAQQKKEFIRRPTRDVHHSTVGIVGFGGVGRRVAELLTGLRTRILATDIFPLDKPPYVEALWPANALARLLAESDIVILTVPLTELTRGMIGKEALAKMKRDALLVNVARGPVVVEADLVEALRAGRLAGAALDVTEEEPLAESSPLWNIPGVIITPHVAGQSRRRADDVTNFFCENLSRYLRGEPLLNLVDKRLGYPRPASRWKGT